MIFSEVRTKNKTETGINVVFLSRIQTSLFVWMVHLDLALDLFKSYILLLCWIPQVIPLVRHVNQVLEHLDLMTTLVRNSEVFKVFSLKNEVSKTRNDEGKDQEAKKYLKIFLTSEIT